MKAFVTIAQGIEIEHQTKVRLAHTAEEAWETLREYHNRQNLWNRVAVTRCLHEFTMESGATMAGHLENFDELIVALEAVGEPIDEVHQLVILLSSLPSDYEIILSIVENMRDVVLIESTQGLREDRREGED